MYLEVHSGRRNAIDKFFDLFKSNYSVINMRTRWLSGISQVGNWSWFCLFSYIQWKHISSFNRSRPNFTHYNLRNATSPHTHSPPNMHTHTWMAPNLKQWMNYLLNSSKIIGNEMWNKTHPNHKIGIWKRSEWGSVCGTCTAIGIIRHMNCCHSSSIPILAGYSQKLAAHV